MISESVTGTFHFEIRVLGNCIALSSNLPFRKHSFPPRSSFLRHTEIYEPFRMTDLRYLRADPLTRSSYGKQPLKS